MSEPLVADMVFAFATKSLCEAAAAAVRDAGYSCAGRRTDKSWHLTVHEADSERRDAAERLARQVPTVRLA